MKTTGTVFTILLAAACWTARAGAQAAPVPLLEPRFTRVFGSDTLRIGWPALSPDGRWIVFNAPAGAGTYNLWIVPGTGGAPRRLTSGAYSDWQPRWFPSGDRIAFRSDRTGGHLMILSIDPVTGEIVSAPRQVTLKPARNFAISPDGQALAYVSPADSGLGRELRIAPAVGGPERVIKRWPEGMSATMVRSWSRDGGSVIALTHDRRRRYLERLPIRGGRPDTLYAGPSHIADTYGAEYLLRSLDAQRGDQSSYELLRVGEGPIGELRLPRGMDAEGFTPDGRSLLAVSADVVAPTTVLPIDGGAARQLVEARAYDWPLGWTADSRGVVLETPLNGARGVLVAPLDRTEMRQLKLPDAADPRFPISVLPGDRLLYGVHAARAATFTLKVFDTRDGSARVVTRLLPTRTIYGAYSTFLAGPGDGSWVDGNDILYFEERQGRTEIYRLPPVGAPRMLYAFPRGQAPLTVAVAGDRVAFARAGKERSEVFVARAGQSPQRILAVDAWANVRLWSRDGRRLLVERAYPEGRVDSDVLVVDFASRGDSVIATRTLDAGAKWWWDLRWLPGDRGIVYLGMGGEGQDDTDVWMLSLEGEQPPVALTHDDPRPMWGVRLSPDGRYVAYAPEIWRGSSIWRVDLSEVLAAGRRP